MNEEILEEILENTKAVKTVIIDKFEKKPKTEKSAKAKAESKFKMIGTKCNLELQSKINNRLEILDMNTNSYIKKLIEDDLSGINNVDKALLNRLKDDLKHKTEELNKYHSMSFLSKLKALFS